VRSMRSSPAPPANEPAVMCSESVYWRCHRRLVSDAAELVRGVTVMHLGHDGRLSRHRLTEGVRRDGTLVAYDGGTVPIHQAVSTESISW
jgi:hypothetical protein